METILSVIALIVSIMALILLMASYSRINRQSSRNEQLVKRLKGDWQIYSSRGEQEILRLYKQFDQLEKETRDPVVKLNGLVGDLDQRLSQFHEGALAMREELERLRRQAGSLQERQARFEEYTRSFLEREVKTAFESFDATVGSVLGEMKSELLKGVERIDDIKAVVDGKRQAQMRIERGQAEAARLLAAGAGGSGASEGPAAPDGGAGAAKEDWTGEAIHYVNDDEALAPEQPPEEFEAVTETMNVNEARQDEEALKRAREDEQPGAPS
ncbi:MAG TPA: hypothetical protein P5137_11480 [Candidatus Brocadiia bacterium]|nr:hypothetical protein [Candidatus Brocadiia bacterium]